MKITVITGKKGKVIGAFHGYSKELKVAAEGLYAIPAQGPGQKFHEVDVPEDILPREATPDILAKFPQRIKKHLRKK